MARFCNGDKVRIKSLKEIEKLSKPFDLGSFGHSDLTLKGVCFLRQTMGKYCGEVATIASKNSDRSGGSASYWLQEFDYSWVEEWLEPYDTTPPADIDISTLL